MMKLRKTRIIQGESGSVPVEFALLFPVFLMIILIIVQGALWYQAQNVAHAAADAAYNNARSTNGSVASGQGAAEAALSHYGSSIHEAGVSVSRSPALVSVTVTGVAPIILPLWSGPTVSQTVSGPTERWVQR